MLSPALFCVYLDDLLKELRQLGLGCYMAGLWLGAVGFADDLLLLAPSRGAMAKMLETCERYAKDHNLQFSTGSRFWADSQNSLSLFWTVLALK